ncbi:MAG: hypothetical protein ABSB15_00990 [Bryobacteraceae bacterium]|jgi:hypothetical protein
MASRQVERRGGRIASPRAGSVESVIDRSRSLSALSRYEVRFDRIYIRAKRELRESRK